MAVRENNACADIVSAPVSAPAIVDEMTPSKPRVIEGTPLSDARRGKYVVLEGPIQTEWGQVKTEAADVGPVPETLVGVFVGNEVRVCGLRERYRLSNGRWPSFVK